MYEKLIQDLLDRAEFAQKANRNNTYNSFAETMSRAADAIKELNKRNDFLMNCIYEAEDSLDRGADNDWARAALEKAERGQDDV